MSGPPEDLGADTGTRVSGSKSIAVLGASGYVGQLLTAVLAEQGHRVIAIGRSQARLASGPRIQPMVVDASDPDAAAEALVGVDAAYYLVHAMAEGGGFAERDRAVARSFATAAQQAAVQRIVYLGGLGGNQLSAHLASRQEVGQVLQESGIPVVELRAAVIIGAGSISFEILRYLTERLPAMVCPKWVDTRLQPLAEADLLAYLCQALEVPAGTYDIGTPEVTTYHDMMQLYASIRGLRRRAIMKVPLLTPSLSARWVDLVTPVDRRVSHALIESLTNEVVVHDAARTAAVFDVEPMVVSDAIRAALDDQVITVADRLLELDEGLADGVYTIRSAEPIPAGRTSAVRRDLARCGGSLAWYGVPRAWQLRLWLGRLFSEHLSCNGPESPVNGAAADWWTIEHIDNASLVLGTTTWFFGDAWLGYRVTPLVASDSDGPARVIQVAAFRPKGLIGFIYWRLLWPVHRFVFRSMNRHRALSSSP